MCVNKEQLLLAKSTRLLEQGRDEPIADLSFDELVKALYIGYEVESKFKVDDWVIFKNDVCVKVLRRILEIDEMNKLVRFSMSSKWEQIEDIVRHATQKEIKEEKERQLWKKIGRDIGEFKEGDVRLVDGYSSVYTSATGAAKNDYNKGELSS